MLLNLLAGPTSAPCGSARKISVLRRRALRNIPLFHPDDSTEQEPRDPSGGGSPVGRTRDRQLPPGITWLYRRKRFRVRVHGEHVGLYRTLDEARVGKAEFLEGSVRSRREVCRAA